MGWSGKIDSTSALGTSTTFTPGTTAMGAYTVSTFTAPKKGIYKFSLKGSGGASQSEGNANGAPGAGGSTEGYLILEAGQTVHIGAGGTCSAAFVAAATGAKLSEIPAAMLYFVAGAGGQGGAASSQNGGNNKVTSGGAGGGSTGANAGLEYGTSSAGGGTQRAGGAGSVGESTGGTGTYGTGGNGVWNNVSWSAWGGRGGDGYYGGGGGGASGYSGGSWGFGGGGGSGYVHKAQMIGGGKTLENTTKQGGGASGNSTGSVVVTYYALAEIPVLCDGLTLEKGYGDGEEFEHLMIDGVTIFCRKICGALYEMRRRLRIWDTGMGVNAHA